MKSLGNCREIRRKARLARIRQAFVKAEDKGKEIDVEKFIAILEVEEGITRRVAREDIKAVLRYLS